MIVCWSACLFTPVSVHVTYYLIVFQHHGISEVTYLQQTINYDQTKIVSLIQALLRVSQKQQQKLWRRQQNG